MSTYRPVTIASVALMTVLFLSELMLFIKVDITSHMAVANFHEYDVVTVRLYVTFPHVDCTGESAEITFRDVSTLCHSLSILAWIWC